jgi:hypothetical protein
MRDQSRNKLICRDWPKEREPYTLGHLPFSVGRKKGEYDSPPMDLEIKKDNGNENAKTECPNDNLLQQSGNEVACLQ